MFDRLLTGMLAVHVLAGVSALVAGGVALAATKGGARHVRAGRWYVMAMAAVVATAVPLSIVDGNLFLLAVAVFSGYLVFAGYRAISTRRSESTTVDLAGHGTMVLVGAAMVAWGGWETIGGRFGLAPVLVAFGAIGTGLAIAELRRLRSPSGDRTVPIVRHLILMSGGFIATVTAVVTVNLTMLPPLARWLGPTAVGVPLIVRAVRKYERRFGTPGAGAAE